MDPVSIAASCIAFTGACRKLVSGLRFLRDVSHAPEHVLALSDELHDLQHVLTAVRLVARIRHDDILGILLAPLFDKVDRIIHEFCDICGVCPRKLKDENEHAEELKLSLLDRVKWTLAKKRINELCERLKIVRLDFSNSLAAISLLDNTHIKSHLNCISDQISYISPRRSINQSEDPPPYDTPSMLFTGQSKTKAFDVEAQGQQIVVSSKQPPSEVQGTRQHEVRSGSCKRACSCVCHSVYRVKTPTVLQSLVGSLLVRHNGLYGLNQACNEHSCRRSNSATVRISYRFPDWLLNRMVSSVLVSNHVNGPQLSLVIPRVVPNTSDIFFQAFAGNIDAVAKLLRSGLASPCDVSGMWGYTPLHYALDRGHMDLCRFLLKAGARAEITDIEDSSATDMAWNKLCLGKVSGKEAEELEVMFKKDDWFEERQFTVLHKIVLGLLPTSRDLHEELSISTSSIEVSDSDGRTPLSWAAELGNLSALQTLLEYDAAVSSKSNNGMTPLHYAAKAPSPACLNALLKNDASVRAKNKWSQSPLNIASYSQNDESFIKPLLDHGANINERDFYGSSALSCAVFMNQFHTAECLLAHGASVGTGDLNVMNDSIENNSHECISLLLNSRANLSTANIHGETSLHVLARRGDLRTIELFQAAELEGLDAEAKTNEGLTAWEVMKQRVDVTDELQNTFQCLLAKIRQESASTTYMDAFEKMSLLPSKVPEVEVRVEEILVDQAA